jgi:hypothetical protein
MSALLKPFGSPTTKLAGTEIAGKNLDPISGEITAPNGLVFPSKAALDAAANASIAAGHSAFGLSR